MKIGAFLFAPRPWPTLAAAAMIALTLCLGRWQTHRAEEKEARQALFEARMLDAPLQLTGSAGSAEPLLYRRVRAAGQWLADGQLFIDNQIHQGRAGFHVITPLQLAGAKAILLVNRGWIARSAQYPRAPQVTVPAGPVEVSGMATLPPRRVLELATPIAGGNVWQNLSIERYAALSSTPVVPVVVLAEAAGAGLAAVRERPDFGVARHREYAMTWFAFAATALGLWIALNLKRSP